MSLSRRWEVLGVLGRLLWANVDLLYFALPRSWRGGYRSPWAALEAKR